MYARHFGHQPTNAHAPQSVGRLMRNDTPNNIAAMLTVLSHRLHGYEPKSNPGWTALCLDIELFSFTVLEFAFSTSWTANDDKNVGQDEEQLEHEF